MFSALGHDPFNQNSDWSDQEKWSTSKGGSWTSFFKTFLVGPNRSIEFWTKISRNLGWMYRTPCFIQFFLARVFFVSPLWRSKFQILGMKKTLTKIWTLRISQTSSKLHRDSRELHNDQLDENSSYITDKVWGLCRAYQCSPEVLLLFVSLSF